MFDGCSLKCAGGSLEVLGNDVPRWMAAAYGQCLWEQNRGQFSENTGFLRSGPVMLENQHRLGARYNRIIVQLMRDEIRQFIGIAHTYIDQIIVNTAHKINILNTP